MRRPMILLAALAGLALAAGQLLAAESTGRPGGDNPMGVHRQTDAKGRETIIYSTGDPSPGPTKQRAEEDRQRSWQMLNNMIIDTRKADPEKNKPKE